MNLPPTPLHPRTKINKPAAMTCDRLSCLPVLNPLMDIDLHVDISFSSAKTGARKKQITIERLNDAA